MSDELFSKKTLWPKRFIALFAAGAILSFGFCGISVFRGVGGDEWWSRTADISWDCCAICLVGLAVSFVWLLISRKEN